MQDIIEVDQYCHLIVSDIEITAIRAQGSGGQHINKVSTAIHLRFDIHRAHLPEETKTRLLRVNDHRITKQGVIVIKAQNTRSQDQNKIDAIDKLVQLIRQANVRQKKRRLTKPTKASVRRRLDSKNNRKQVKQQRKKVLF